MINTELVEKLQKENRQLWAAIVALHTELGDLNRSLSELNEDYDQAKWTNTRRY